MRHSSCAAILPTRDLMLLFLRGLLYGAWTQNFPHDPSDPCGTADTVGVATINDHPCRAGSTWTDAVTAGGWGADHEHCRRGRDQPALCLQMGTAVSRRRAGGVGKQTRRTPPARAVSA